MRREEGFTLIELMVVVAIIAILAAFAIPQYMKYQANARLSNVQEFTKSLANLAINLAASSVQNPQCVNESHFDIEYSDPYLVSHPHGNSNVDCDKVRAYNRKPGWLDNVTINNLEVEVTGTESVISGGEIQVKSNYSIGNGKYIGCKYNGTALSDLDNTYFCHLE